MIYALIITLLMFNENGKLRYSGDVMEYRTRAECEAGAIRMREYILKEAPGGRVLAACLPLEVPVKS